MKEHLCPYAAAAMLIAILALLVALLGGCDTLCHTPQADADHAPNMPAAQFP